MASNLKASNGCIKAVFIILIFSYEAMAQNEVAIGSATTKSNAILWLNGNGSQGLILPVVTNKSSVSNPDKGMIVYDNTDNKLWYRNDNTWVEVGAGGGSTTTNLNLQRQGNQLQLRDGTTVQSTVNIAAGTETNGAFLVFTDGSWQYATLTGDVTGANGALQVNGIRGKTITTLPATAQALVYDPATNGGAGGWVFQVLTTGATVPTLSNGQLLTGNGTTNAATTITGDAALSGSALTINDNAITTAKINANAVDATKLADNSVTTTKISDATITGADIAASTITTDKLAQSAATTGQVLKWNGTSWVPQNETTATTTILSNGQILTGNGTANAATTLSGDATLSGGALTIGNNAITTAKINAAAVDATKLADNAVTSAKIQDGTIGNADISPTAAIAVTKVAPGTNGQVLTTVAGVPAWSAASVGTVTSVTAGAGLTGGTITNSGTVAVNVGTGANQIPQLDGSGKLNVATIPTGINANQIVQLDGTGKLPAVDGSQLTNLPSRWSGNRSSREGHQRSCEIQWNDYKRGRARNRLSYPYRKCGRPDQLSDIESKHNRYSRHNHRQHYRKSGDEPNDKSC